MGKGILSEVQLKSTGGKCRPFRMLVTKTRGSSAGPREALPMSRIELGGREVCSEAISIFCPPCDCPTKMLCIFVGALFGGGKGGSSKSREQSLSHFVTAPFTQGSLWRRAGMTTLPSFLRQATVSRGSARASVRKCPEQWGISKFASGKEPTGLFARKHLFTPYTGEAREGKV